MLEWVETKLGRTYLLIYYPRVLNKMYLMYYLNDKGERVYTLNKVDPSGKPTLSAHPGNITLKSYYLS